MESLPKSLKAAVLAGSKLYFTGKPCKSGHICNRYTCNHHCVQCHNNFYVKNKAKISVKTKEYKDKNTDLYKERWKAWYASNSEKHKKKNAKYYRENLDKVKVYQKKRYEKKKEEKKEYSKNWAINNKDRVRQNVKRWQAENPEAVRNYKRNCEAKRKNALGSHTSNDVLKLYKQQKEKCINCMCSIKEKYHVDHIMPLALGGSNNASNLQLLCQSCNCKKHAKHPVDWALENGRLV